MSDFVMNRMEHKTSKEQFLRMKARQKAITQERRTGDEERAFNRLMGEWSALCPKKTEPHIYVKCNLGHTHGVTNPEYAAYQLAVKEWKEKRPARPASLVSHDTEYARSFNIAYGLAKGRTYAQIEKKWWYGPNWDQILEICFEYGFLLTREMRK